MLKLSDYVNLILTAIFKVKKRDFLAFQISNMCLQCELESIFIKSHLLFSPNWKHPLFHLN